MRPFSTNIWPKVVEPHEWFSGSEVARKDKSIAAIIGNF